MDNTLVIFMKAPVPGMCKTRLTPPLAAAQAADLYRAFCADTLAAMRSVPAEPLIAYAPHPDFPTPSWGSADPFFEQSGADLGERIVRAFETAFAKGCERVVCVGTDAPSLPPGHVAEAFAALAECDAVFGPAEDGGYTLVGLRRMIRGLFREIPWSTKNVLAKTKEILARDGVSARFTPPHYDVDSAAGLRRLARDLADPHAAAICPKTKSLLDRFVQEKVFLP